MTINLGWSRQKGEVKELNTDVADAFKSRALDARLQYMRPTQFKTQAVFRSPIKRLSTSRGFTGASFVASLNYVHESGGFWDLNVNRPNPMDTARRLNARIGLQTDHFTVHADAAAVAHLLQ